MSKPLSSSKPLSGPRVSVVVPVLNEAENLPHILPIIPPEYEVVLVDGASTDDTVAVARSLLPDIVVVEQNGKGKGNAICCGIAASTGDVIVMLDADGSADPKEIPDFVAALKRGADFAKGTRFLPGGGSDDFTWHRQLGNHFLTAIANRLFHQKYTDLCYGYNAFWKSIFDRLELDGNGFEIEALLNLRIIRANLLVSEVPSFEHRRLFGVSKLHAFRDGWRILRTIIRERRDARPLQIGKFSEWEKNLQPTMQIKILTDSTPMPVVSEVSPRARSVPQS